MKQIDEDSMDSSLSYSSVATNEDITNMCKYVQKYFGNRECYVVETNGNFYLGRIVRNKSDFTVLENPAKVNINNQFSITETNDEHIKISNADNIYEPVFKELSREYELVVHYTDNTATKYIELEDRLQYPLLNRVSTVYHPYVTEYHCYIGNEVYNSDSNNIEFVDNVTIDSKSIDKSGYLNEDMQLPLLEIEQPNTEYYSNVPMVFNYLAFTADEHNISNTVNLNGIFDSIEYMAEHPYVKLLSGAGIIHDSQHRDFLVNIISAYADSYYHFGTDGRVAYNLVSWSKEDLEQIMIMHKDNQSNKRGKKEKQEKDNNDLGREKIKENNEKLNNELQDVGVIMFGEKTDDERVIKHPFISMGAYSIPLSNILPQDLVGRSQAGLIDFFFSHNNSTTHSSDDVTGLIQLLSNYDRESDTYKLTPVCSIDYNKFISFNRGTKTTDAVDIVFNSMQKSINKEISFDTDEVSFIDDHKEDDTGVLLAHRANIREYSNTVSIIVDGDEDDGTWVARKELFESAVDVPTTLSIQKGDERIEYTDVTVSAIDENDIEGSMPVTIRPTAVEDSNTEFEPVIFGSNTDYDSDGVYGMYNTELSNAISKGDLLPPATEPEYRDNIPIEK